MNNISGVGGSSEIPDFGPLSPVKQGSQNEPESSVAGAPPSKEEQEVPANLPVIPFPWITHVPQDQLLEDLAKLGMLMGMDKGPDAGSALMMQQAIESRLKGIITSNMVKSAQASAEMGAKNSAEQRKEDMRLEQIRTGVQHMDRGSEMAKGKGPGGVAAVMAMGTIIAMGFPATQIFGASTAQALAAIKSIGIDTALAGIATAFGSGLVIRSSILSLVKAGQMPEMYNEEFVANLAKETIASLPLVSKAAILVLSDANITPKEAKIKEHIVTLILISNALALGYRAEHGGVSSKEFNLFFDPSSAGIKYDKSDPRSLLVSTAQLYFSMLNELSPKVAKDVKKRYEDYLDSSPSIAELLGPKDAIHSMFQPQLRTSFAG